MANVKTITELTTLATVDSSTDWLPVVDASDTTESSNGTTKKALVDQFIGDTGPQGDAATVSAGTTTTGAAGTDASVTNSGTTSAAVFNFTIPRGNTGLTGAAGADGTDGVDAYVYIAYASDASGTGFTTTFNANLDYIAIKTTTTEIATPAASDFVGLWKNYKGVTGDQGIQGETGPAGVDGDDAYVYIAYASDASGTGFTTTFNASLDYIAVKATTTAIATPSASDFTGLWKNYKGATGAAGTDGVDGDDAYVYIAYASDASGTGFTTTFDSALDYIAVKNTTTPIASPTASDFTGLWKNYKGEQGIQGVAGTDGTDGADAYLYIAYASDDTGTGFTMTFNAALDYIAVKNTTTPIATPSASDFTGLWKNYKGAAGTNGTDGTDGLDINWRGTYAAGTTYAVNDAVFYDGSSYICILGSTGNLPTNTTYWDLMAQEGAAGAGSGDVSGPSSATDNAIARYDLTTGKLIQNSTVTIDDSGSVNIPAGQSYLVNGSPVSGYSDEQAQDAIGSILTDSSEVDFTYDGATPSITATLKSGSIDEAKLDTSVNASLDLADNSIQKTTNITALNETGIADGEIAVFNLTNKDIRTSDKTIVTTIGADDTTVPTSKAVNDAIAGFTSYSDEQAQDAVGTILTDTATVDFTYTDGTPSITADVKDASVANAKLANMATKTYKGRTSATTGVPEDVDVATLKTDLALVKADVGLGNVDNTSDATKNSATVTLTNKTIDGDANTISNLAHGAEVDNPASGVHGVTGSVVGTTDTQTLSAKTLTSPVLDTGVSGTAVLDEDDMASNSATKLATQQSIKAYVDAKGFTWKGPWATSTPYDLNDTVESNGSGYVCTSAHTSGTTTEPGIGASWATVWDLFVEGLPEPNLTTATTTNLTGVITGNGSVIGSKANPTGDIVGTTDTQTLTNKTLTAPALSSPTISGAWDGWISAGETWTYASADDPTFTFTIAADVTTKYSAGMKIKLTQGTVKYFIITAVSTYSGGNTTITVYGGTDYDLANAAISLNYYSTQKAPFGFPMSPAKWTQENLMTSAITQATPATGTIYNLGGSLSIPIGIWDVVYQTPARCDFTGAFSMVMTTLSTANNSESDKNWTSYAVSGSTAIGANAFRSGVIERTSKATYYLNFWQAAGVEGSNLYVFGNLSTAIIRATCAYL